MPVSKSVAYRCYKEACAANNVTPLKKWNDSGCTVAWLLERTAILGQESESEPEPEPEPEDPEAKNAELDEIYARQNRFRAAFNAESARKSAELEKRLRENEKRARENAQRARENEQRAREHEKKAEYHEKKAREYEEAARKRRGWHVDPGMEATLKKMGWTDPIKILGLTNFYTRDEAKKAYRKLALVHHPDKGGSEDLFKVLLAAYEYTK